MENLENTNRPKTIIWMFFLALLALFVLSFFLGRFPIRPGELIGLTAYELIDLIPGDHSNIQPFWAESVEGIFLNVRMPRVLLACLVGCCISMAGAAYQGVFQNPMAAPDLLGASSGAAFGAALGILIGGNSWTITGFAFLSSLVTVGLVMLVGEFASGSRVIGLILGGIIISSLFSSGTSYLKLVADPNDELPKITYWLMGSLTEAKMSQVAFAAVPMAIGIIPLLLFSWRINVLTLGDEEAETIGVNAKRVRIVVIVCATLITAASVSVSGMIGWVGLVVPHFARRIVGNNYLYLMPLTMIIGAMFLLGVDDISRNLMAKEIPLGILTSLVGAPFFIYLLVRKEKIL